MLQNQQIEMDKVRKEREKNYDKPLPSPSLPEGEKEENIPPLKLDDTVEDFICISEFSEHKGPVVVKLLPNDNVGKFDIESHVLRIMAVDYQNQTTQGSAFACDSQSVEPAEDLYSYVCYEDHSPTFMLLIMINKIDSSYNVIRYQSSWICETNMFVLPIKRLQ